MRLEPGGLPQKPFRLSLPRSLHRHPLTFRTTRDGHAPPPHDAHATPPPQAFFDLDARALACTEAHVAGATATVALVRGKRLWVAGVGDSRCVLSHAGTAQVR